MKKLYTMAVLFTLALLLNSSVFGQSTTDTVYIPGAQSLEISSIVNADTSVTDHRVYVLDRGAIYYIENAFEITSSCAFMAKGDESLRPPVLSVAIRADNSNEEWYFKFIQTGISVELNDLYLLSMRSDGKTLGWSRALWVGADDISLTMRNIVLDGFTEAGIKVTSRNYSLDVQDCHFRNFIHSTSYFGGQPFLSDQAPYKSIKFINNTFFACNSYLFSVRGHGDEAIFEHNTVMYGAVNPMLIRQADNLFMKNNLFVNSHAWGGDPEQTIGGWFFQYPDTISTSVYRIRKNMVYNGYEVSGPEAYDDSAAGLIFDKNQWTNVNVNNANYFTEDLVKFYSDWNDTVTVYDSVSVITGPKQYLKRVLNMPRYLNDLGYTVLDSVTNPELPDYSPNIEFADNIDGENPNFTDAATVAHSSELIGYISRIASRSLDNGWQYEMAFPPAWPIPENLEYTNSSFLNGGNDGFALGDLNWFPEQKKAWDEGTSVTYNENTIAEEYTLGQNYPNPFNPTTSVEFSIPKQATVSMKVFNVLGQEVAQLVNKEMTAGSYTVSFDASQLTSGIYFYTIQAGDFTATKKMMLLK